jgi:hypothetical protein
MVTSIRSATAMISDPKKNIRNTQNCHPPTPGHSQLSIAHAILRGTRKVRTALPVRVRGSAEV